MRSEFCRCKICGAGAEVFPRCAEEAEELRCPAVLITCEDCKTVEVWGYEKEGQNYEERRALAGLRWNKIMGGNDEADRISM